MAYPVYNTAALLAASSTAQYKNNKGVLIIPSGTAGTAVLNLYSHPGGGTQGEAKTVQANAKAAPFVVPIRIHSTGAVSNCTVHELL